MDYSKLLSTNGSSQPLTGQVRTSIEAAIEDGRLVAGTRLPSERDLARDLRLSRTTVTTAYRELESRGLIRSHVGRGTFVAARLEAADAPFAWRGKVSAGAQRVPDSDYAHLMRASINPALISFALGSPAIECFPRQEFQRAVKKALDRDAGRVLGLGPVEGQPALRRAIAERLGTKVRKEQILVVSGSQQGLDLLARCLLDPGDTVILDRPAYMGAMQTFRSAGASLVGWDTLRADLSELEDLILRYRPKLLYVNPTFHNPTGRTMPLRDRRELLKLAARYRLPVIEDDPYRELYFEDRPPASLYELDQYQIVIYLSTFSKCLAPGLRLGWLAASESIVDQLARIKHRANAFTEGLGQFVLTDFLESGFFESHLEGIRAEHKKRRNTMLAALRKHLPANALQWHVSNGGMYLWCRLGHGLDATQLYEKAVLAGVVFAKGELFYPDHCGARELRLCFSSLPADRIEEGAKRLGESFRQAIEDRRVSEVFASGC